MLTDLFKLQADMLTARGELAAGIVSSWLLNRVAPNGGGNRPIVTLQDSRDTVHKTFNSDGLRPALATQARFMGFVGKKGISVACDAAGIYLRTIKNATGPLWNIRS